MKLSELLEQLDVEGTAMEKALDYEVRIECDDPEVYEPRGVRFEHSDNVVVIEA